METQKDLLPVGLPQDPVFIVGYPRSGTTLLQRLLVTQPGIFSFRETHYFTIIEKHHIQCDERGNILPSCLDTVFEKINEKMEFQFAAEEKEAFYQRAESRELTSKDLFESIVIRFLLQQPGIAGNGSVSFRWIEKTPTHANFLDRIFEFYPAARALHIVRHPVPAIFSRKLKFPFNRETPLEKLARGWNRLVENVERFKEMFPGHIYTLKYEDLVKNLEKELKPAVDFLNIPFDFTLIAGIKQKQASSSESFILPSEPWKVADRNREVVNTNDAYKDIITPSDAEIIEEIVRKNMEKHGYTSW
jgi:hypothetical protein